MEVQESTQLKVIPTWDNSLENKIGDQFPELKKRPWCTRQTHVSTIGVNWYKNSTVSVVYDNISGEN